MPTPRSGQPVVVTFREIERILTGREAVGCIQEAATRDPEASAVEKAAVMASMGRVLTQLRKVEQDAGALVLTSPHDGPASRLQSLIASGDAGSLTFQPLATGGLEAKFEPTLSMPTEATPGGDSRRWPPIDRCWAALADARFSCTRRAAGATQGFRGRGGGGRRKRIGKRRSRWSSVVIMGGRLCPDQGLKINPAGRGFGEGQA